MECLAEGVGARAGQSRKSHARAPETMRFSAICVAVARIHAHIKNSGTGGLQVFSFSEN